MAKPTVLVIDDHKKHVELVRYNLTENGFDVITAQRGEAELEIAIRHKPDLILLDVVIPRMDGPEVCRRLCSNDGTSRIECV